MPSTRRASILGLWLLLSLCHHQNAAGGGSQLTFIKAADSQVVSWEGRTFIDQKEGTVVLDWPGTTARLTLTKGANLVTAVIEDSTAIGTRFSVYLVSKKGPEWIEKGRRKGRGKVRGIHQACLLMTLL